MQAATVKAAVQFLDRGKAYSCKGYYKKGQTWQVPQILPLRRHWEGPGTAHLPRRAGVQRARNLHRRQPLQKRKRVDFKRVPVGHDKINSCLAVLAVFHLVLGRMRLYLCGTQVGSAHVLLKLFNTVWMFSSGA